MQTSISLLSLKLTAEEIAKFNSLIKTGSPDECWPWIYKPAAWGYGQFRFRSKPRQQVRCHRIAFFLHWGIDPGEWKVCHECDNPICCNWHHLFVGTQKINMEDKVRKGREACGERSGSAWIPSEQVSEMRRLYDSGVKIKQLVDRFGVSFSHTARIVYREARLNG